MGEYVLGVDGGNTKTHYALFNTQGELVNFIEGGPSSHYHFPDAYEGAAREIRKNVDALLGNVKGDIRNIACSIFGLSGIDAKSQHKKISEQISKQGFCRFKIFNDAFLGIKAGSQKGYGICSINGTSTCCAAIDGNQRLLQVGGPRLVGDESGASRIGGLVIKRVYDAFFRDGPPTLMTKMLFERLEIKQADEIVDAILKKVDTKRVRKDSLAKIAFDAANLDDQVACVLLDHAGRESARSVIGAIEKLDFTNEAEIDVVMAGSVYLKGEHPALITAFQNQISNRVEQSANFILLQVPPVAGAVVWATEELVREIPPAVRKNILQSLMQM